MILVNDLLLILSELGGHLALLIIALGEGASAYDVDRPCRIFTRLEGQLVGTGLP
jgi:hypothetical protein